MERVRHSSSDHFHRHFTLGFWNEKEKNLYEMLLICKTPTAILDLLSVLVFYITARSVVQPFTEMMQHQGYFDKVLYGALDIRLDGHITVRTK